MVPTESSAVDGKVPLVVVRRLRQVQQHLCAVVQLASRLVEREVPVAVLRWMQCVPTQHVRTVVCHSPCQLDSQMRVAAV